MFITAVCVLYLNKQNCFLLFINESSYNLFETAVKVGTEYQYCVRYWYKIPVSTILKNDVDISHDKKNCSHFYFQITRHYAGHAILIWVVWSCVTLRFSSTVGDFRETKKMIMVTPEKEKDSCHMQLIWISVKWISRNFNVINKLNKPWPVSFSIKTTRTGFIGINVLNRGSLWMSEEPECPNKETTNNLKWWYMPMSTDKYVHGFYSTDTLRLVAICSVCGKTTTLLWFSLYWVLGKTVKGHPPPSIKT